MVLNWNEIKTRAVSFTKEWETTEREEADAKEFLIEFLNVFGVTRRRVATFEHRVKKLNEGQGYIDLLWPGMLLVEMKSRGKDLEKAYKQAKEYCHGLKEYELPKLILISDFHHFDLYDEEGSKSSFVLPDLLQNVQLFAALAGYQKRIFKEQDPVNIEAAERMGKLHDKLETIGYDGHNLELYLVRLLFCLFGDDTGIFDKGIFLEWIEEKTNEDGGDLAANISQLFQVLNTPEDKRLTVLDESLAAFPYVNGKLFEESLPVAAFDSQMRKLLLDCCALDWGKISPAIFGSLFQSVMDEKARRNLGAHYTSEKNILKLIKPLFLDDLWKEYETVKLDKNKLQRLHQKISKLRYLDPACGCGNFLIIAYRELRLLELEIVKSILKGQQVTSINDYFLVDVDQFYGIEYEEFSSQIATVAMWLMDHQINSIASLQFGEYYKRIPLKKSATIVHGNALRIDWDTLLDTDSNGSRIVYDFILGNPPFVGSRMMNSAQKEDLAYVFGSHKKVGDLDLVSAWFLKAAKHIQETKTKVGFVSTNSISQGLQVGLLWQNMLDAYQIKIHFAHQTFKWSNESKGNAAVYCVIIGFASIDAPIKKLYEYNDVKGEPLESRPSNINPYLVDGKNVIIHRLQAPICDVPPMHFGNMPADGGELLFTAKEKDTFITEEPASSLYFRKFLGAYEFINNIERWCLWLEDAKPNELRQLNQVVNRIEKVREIRMKSSRPELANIPHLFAQITQPKGVDYVIVPSVSSERRTYIPIGFVRSNVIASNLCLIIPKATSFHFGILTSSMHMAWVKYVGGRLKSDFRYSKDIVYNNFPWPENPPAKSEMIVRNAAQGVLDARLMFPESSLADLYDPNTMPPELVKAHQTLDKAVDLCYRPQPFTSEAKRIEFLFELYDKYTAGLFLEEKKSKKKA